MKLVFTSGLALGYDNVDIFTMLIKNGAKIDDDDDVGSTLLCSFTRCK